MLDTILHIVSKTREEGESPMNESTPAKITASVAGAIGLSRDPPQPDELQVAALHFEAIEAFEKLAEGLRVSTVAMARYDRERRKIGNDR